MSLTLLFNLPLALSLCRCWRVLGGATGNLSPQAGAARSLFRLQLDLDSVAFRLRIQPLSFRHRGAAPPLSSAESPEIFRVEKQRRGA